ncbi:MAG TPA: hypothetical protein VEK13_07665 [Thermoplasmata archaeon]|nr:hypothetical protein [Thermoplasmata archaeon]
MERRVELVIDPLRQEKVGLSLPLSFRRPVEETARELGFPPTIDLGDSIVAKAVVLADAARRASPPVQFAVFGGTAFRLTCPSSNERTLGLRHEIHDMDLAILLKEAREFRRFLSTVRDVAGSGLTFFETSGDRIYNSLSGGLRLRWHMVISQQGSEIALGTLDIIADEFRFCHRIDIRSDVEHSPVAGWSLSPLHLLLTKGQFIQRIPKDEASAVNHRVLEPFGKRQVVIGPEAKDVRDMLALLLDHPIGNGAAEVSLEGLARELDSDWGLWKTFGLNLQMMSRSSILRDLPPGPRATVTERLERMRDLVRSLSPKRPFALFGGPWWQEVDTTPSVDSSVSVG